jgi:hypothetical protein
MGKVFGMHEFELRPGASEAELKRLLLEWQQYPQHPGVRLYVLKGNRGVRDGKYLLMTECESVATRDRYWPDGIDESDEWKAIAASQTKLRALDVPFGRLFAEEHPYTDYEVIAMSP